MQTDRFHDLMMKILKLRIVHHKFDDQLEAVRPLEERYNLSQSVVGWLFIIACIFIYRTPCGNIVKSHPLHLT